MDSWLVSSVFSYSRCSSWIDRQLCRSQSPVLAQWKGKPKESRSRILVAAHGVLLVAIVCEGAEMKLAPRRVNPTN